METMNEERAGFEDVYPAAEILVFEDGKYAKRHESRWQSDAVEAINRMWQAFQAGAAWQRAQCAAVPDGYALVPVEPTPAMRVIGARDCSSLIQPDQAGEVWRAMLGAVVVPAEYAFAAAPAHQAERQEQGEVQRLREALEAKQQGGAAQSAPVIDLDANAWESIKQAASESKWIPAQYFMGDWAADVCEFLRVGRCTQSAGVPEGWALVPKHMSLSPADIAAIMFQCGGDEDAEEFEDRFNGGVLWVGETLDDDGSKSYGLNIACVECLEEGSTPVVEFSPPTMLAAAPTVKAEQVQCEFHGDDSSACEKYSGNVPCEPAPAHQAERQEQGEVQRLREALGRIRKQAVELECKQSPCSATQRDFAEIAYMADAALAASTGQEV